MNARSGTGRSRRSSARRRRPRARRRSGGRGGASRGSRACTTWRSARVPGCASLRDTPTGRSSAARKLFQAGVANVQTSRAIVPSAADDERRAVDLLAVVDAALHQARQVQLARDDRHVRGGPAGRAEDPGDHLHHGRDQRDHRLRDPQEGLAEVVAFRAARARRAARDTRATVPRSDGMSGNDTGEPCADLNGSRSHAVTSRSRPSTSIRSRSSASCSAVGSGVRGTSSGHHQLEAGRRLHLVHLDPGVHALDPHAVVGRVEVEDRQRRDQRARAGVVVVEAEAGAVVAALAVAEDGDEVEPSRPARADRATGV